MAPRSSSAAPPLATITGSTTSGMSAALASITAQAASIVSAVGSMPVFRQSAPRSSSTTSICSATKAGATWTTPCTPSVFCAVSAVTALAA